LNISISKRSVGPGSPCFVIAEVAQAHDGSLGTAHAYIDVVARTGADAIKFQTHLAAAESTPGEPFRVKFSPQDETRFDYWKRMEFTPSQWAGLAKHAADKELIFLSTPFSMEAIDLLTKIGVPAWKVGSGEVTNLPMLRRMASAGDPVILSSGMSPWEDLDQAVNTIRQAGADVALLQCTTAYPCPAEKIGLNVIHELRERYQCPAGLSDHSGTIYPGLAATSLGSDLLEIHIVLSRDCFGPDVGASVTPTELTQLVDGIRFIETCLKSPVNKAAVADEMSELRTIFGKSVVAADDLPVGHILTDADLALKKPGTGISASRYDELLGRKLTQAVTRDTMLSEDHLD